MKRKILIYLRDTFVWECMLMQTKSPTYKFLGILSWICWITLFYVTFNLLAK